MVRWSAVAQVTVLLIAAAACGESAAWERPADDEEAVRSLDPRREELVARLSVLEERVGELERALAEWSTPRGGGTPTIAELVSEVRRLSRRLEGLDGFSLRRPCPPWADVMGHFFEIHEAHFGNLEVTRSPRCVLE